MLSRDKVNSERRESLVAKEEENSAGTRINVDCDPGCPEREKSLRTKARATGCKKYNLAAGIMRNLGTSAMSLFSINIQCCKHLA